MNLTIRIIFLSLFMTACCNALSENCGGNFTDDFGEILSPNYPEKYEDSLNCVYIIGKENEYISLFFDVSFSLENHSTCMKDYITISHANEVNTTQGPYCGSAAPVNRTLQGPVVITFVTDSSYVEYGFRVYYDSTKCGVNITDAYGMLGSPYVLGGPIPHSVFYQWMDCNWTIVGRPNTVIALKFLRMNIKADYRCSSEYLEVRDGSKQGSVISKLCGKSLLTIKSIEASVFVKLHVRFSSHFLAFHYLTYGPKQGCGGILNKSSGRLEGFDVDGDGRYEANLDCNWLIIGDDDKVIRIDFIWFEVDNKSNGTCSDFLELRENDSVGVVILKHCGFAIPTPVITSSNRVNVLFHSDGRFKYNPKGFRFNFISTDSTSFPTNRNQASQPLLNFCPGTNLNPASVFIIGVICLEIRKFLFLYI